MQSLKKTTARKAAKSAARHTVHGTASKLKRDPIRSAALVGVGCVAGVLAGWALGRGANAAPALAS